VDLGGKEELEGKERNQTGGGEREGKLGRENEKETKGRRKGK
jgi:hypothetical protein